MAQPEEPGFFDKLTNAATNTINGVSRKYNNLTQRGYGTFNAAARAITSQAGENLGKMGQDLGSGLYDLVGQPDTSPSQENVQTQQPNQPPATSVQPAAAAASANGNQPGQAAPAQKYDQQTKAGLHYNTNNGTVNFTDGQGGTGSVTASDPEQQKRFEANLADKKGAIFGSAFGSQREEATPLGGAQANANPGYVNGLGNIRYAINQSQPPMRGLGMDNGESNGGGSYGLGNMPQVQAPGYQGGMTPYDEEIDNTMSDIDHNQLSGYDSIGTMMAKRGNLAAFHSKLATLHQLAQSHLAAQAQNNGLNFDASAENARNAYGLINANQDRDFQREMTNQGYSAQPMPQQNANWGGNNINQSVTVGGGDGQEAEQDDGQGNGPAVSFAVNPSKTEQTTYNNKQNNTTNNNRYQETRIDQRGKIVRNHYRGH